MGKGGYGLMKKVMDYGGKDVDWGKWKWNKEEKRWIMEEG